jgi:hypothetical protein
MAESVLWAVLLLASLGKTLQKEFSEAYPIGNELEFEGHYLYNLTLPSKFHLGVSSAAYQYEGAWDEGGKQYCFEMCCLESNNDSA